MTTERFEPKALPGWRRALIALRTELVGIHPRLHAYNIAISALPRRAGSQLRVELLRLVGFDVGAGTLVKGALKLSGPRGLMGNLRIGKDCNIDVDCTFDLSESVAIADRVTIEPGVMILTSTHELDFPQHRAGKVITSPVSIGEGAWLRARAIVLPGVRIGAGAVVEAGAVVNKDVEPNLRVGGIPASKLEALQTNDEA